MKNYPLLSDVERLQKFALPSNGRLQIVLDTDTYNEIDDQFAVTYALLSTERLDVKALYAAPFYNARSSGPEDGMQKSYEEILRLLSRLSLPADGFVFRGSDRYLEGKDSPVESDAVDHLVSLARKSEDLLYVVAIGAITNVASAILEAPDIVDRIVVVWLGGHAHYWEHTREFNLQQDVAAAQIIFDCGVPFVQVPCLPVASRLLTTKYELSAHLTGKNEISDYLVQTFVDYHTDHYAWAKEIWDVSTIGYLINEQWAPTNIVHSPKLNDEKTWTIDTNRHLMKVVRRIDRNAMFADMFKKIAAAE